MALDALFFAKAAHTYWDIENRLHWMFVFQADLMRL